MTHESEATFATEVEALLVDTLGHAAVRREHRYQTGREVDLLVRGPLGTWCLELENDADSIIHGAAQARLYAAHHPHGRAVPMVIVPDGHKLEDPELDYVQSDVPVLDLSDLEARLDAWCLSQE